MILSILFTSYLALSTQTKYAFNYDGYKFKVLSDSFKTAAKMCVTHLREKYNITIKQNDELMDVISVCANPTEVKE